VTDVVARSQTAPVSRVRVVTTVFGTLLVVLAEFLLLYGVYQRSEPVSRAQVAVAVLDGQLRTVTAGHVDALAGSARLAADRATSPSSTCRPAG